MVYVRLHDVCCWFNILKIIVARICYCSSHYEMGAAHAEVQAYALTLHFTVLNVLIF